MNGAENAMFLFVNKNTPKILKIYDILTDNCKGANKRQEK